MSYLKGGRRGWEDLQKGNSQKLIFVPSFSSCFPLTSFFGLCPSQLVSDHSCRLYWLVQLIACLLIPATQQVALQSECLCRLLLGSSLHLPCQYTAGVGNNNDVSAPLDTEESRQQTTASLVDERNSSSQQIQGHQAVRNLCLLGATLLTTLSGIQHSMYPLGDRTSLTFASRVVRLRKYLTLALWDIAAEQLWTQVLV